MSHPTPRYHASLCAPAAVMTIIPRQVQAMVVLLLVAVSLSLFLFVPHTLADEQMPEAPGSIAGVVRTASGTLQAGIQVTLFTPLGNVIQAFTTQADGAYRFWLLPAGIYRVGISDPQRIYAPLYYPAVPTLAKATNVSVAGNQVTGIDLTLQPAGQITGIITAALGFTLTSASVSLLQEIELSGNSFWQTIQTVNLPADGGVYTFTGLSADDYRICAIGYYFTLYKYECYDNVYTIERATSLTLTIGATVSNINLSLGDNADFAEIRGRVTTLTNEPLAGIEVYGMLIPSVGRSNTLARSTFPVPTFIPTSPPILDPAYGYSFATRTDKNGNYQLSGLEGGRYRLFFSEPTGAYAFEYYNDALTIEQATLIDVRPGQIISDVNVQLGLGSQIQGALTMLGQPPRDAYVTAEMKTPFGWQSIVNGRVQSDTGYYRIGGLSAGIYRMAAFSEVYDGSTIYFYRGYFGGNIADTATAIALAVGETRRADITLTGGPLFEGGVAGRVTAGGVPLAGAKVALYKEPLSCCVLELREPIVFTFTNAEGDYSLNGLVGGAYVLGVTDPTSLYATTYYTGHAIPSVANLLRIEDSKILTNVNVALPVAGAIHGRVTTITGQPVAGLRVTVHANQRFDQIVDLSYLVSGNTRTDGDGQYTVKGLHAGEYYVCFIGGNNYIHCYGAPSTPDQGYLVINASPVNVASGGTTSDIDLLWGSVLATYLPLIAR